MPYPLHKTVHWRKIKKLLLDLCNHEKVNILDYDLSSITCYSVIGDELKGRNVTYKTINNNSIWVSDNHYDIFEVPKKGNHSKYHFTGEFLFLAHNTSYDYWLFGTMNDTISFRNRHFIEKVHYKPYGKYIVASNKLRLIFHKELKGFLITLGAHVIPEDGPYFDHLYR